MILKKLQYKITNFFKDYDGIFTYIINYSYNIIHKDILKKKQFSKYFNCFFCYEFYLFSVNNNFQKDFQVKSNIKNFDFEKSILKLKRQNIYLFIVDAMPPIEIADKILNTDSNNFLNELNSKGFTYIKIQIAWKYIFYTWINI